jgi:5-methyltetrahydrofolate--homocysteine methyltransferase
MDQSLPELQQAILEGEKASAIEAVQAALKSGLEPQAVLNAMIAAMDEVGRLFEEGEYFVPEMLIAARAMQACLDILNPHLADHAIEPVGRVVIGTVKGDLHDIGKNLVAVMLEGAGFKIINLGVDVSPEKFVEAIHDHHPNIVALSALLTTTMPGMKTIIEAIQAAGLRDQVKIMVGGAPLNDGYARLIGADGYSPDASSAVKLAKQLISR